MDLAVARLIAWPGRRQVLPAARNLGGSGRQIAVKTAVKVVHGAAA